MGRVCLGMAWCKRRRPGISPPPFAPNDDVRVSILKIRIPANWAQITEGQIDSAHSSSLHSSDMLPARVEGAAADEKSWYRPSTDKSPRMQTQTMDYGFHYAALCRNPPPHQGGRDAQLHSRHRIRRTLFFIDTA
jgi:phthalate 4,5-dioxygenase oxygenase subunit